MGSISKVYWLGSIQFWINNGMGYIGLGICYYRRKKNHKRGRGGEWIFSSKNSLYFTLWKWEWQCNRAGWIKCALSPLRGKENPHGAGAGRSEAGQIGGTEIYVGYSKEVNGTYGAGLWKHIRKVWDHFASYVQYEVGEGSQMLVWKNHWDGSSTFQDKYLKLFRFARNKDAQWLYGMNTW